MCYGSCLCFNELSTHAVKPFFAPSRRTSASLLLLLLSQHICECHAQEAQKFEAEQPKASPEKQAESESAAQSPEMSAAHEKENAADEHAASTISAHAISDAEDDAATDTPTSTSSWHGTPTWNDMTTFSQVGPCTERTWRAPSPSIYVCPEIHDESIK